MGIDKAVARANAAFSTFKSRKSGAGKGDRHRSLNHAFWDAPYWKAREAAKAQDTAHTTHEGDNLPSRPDAGL